MEILKVENLCKTYGMNDTEVRALDNISFSVERGEFVAIIGASGSGKSTLLHLIGGVDRATAGKIYIDGTEISDLNNDKIIDEKDKAPILKKWRFLEEDSWD